VHQLFRRGQRVPCLLGGKRARPLRNNSFTITRYLKRTRNTKTRTETTWPRKPVGRVPCTWSANNTYWDPTETQWKRVVFFDTKLSYANPCRLRTSFTEQSHDADMMKSSMEFWHQSTLHTSLLCSSNVLTGFYACTKYEFYIIPHRTRTVTSNRHYLRKLIIPHLHGPVSAAGDQHAVHGSAPDHVEQPVFPMHLVLDGYRTFFTVVRHQEQRAAAFETVILRRGYG